MAHDKVYGICENKCAVEVYAKDQDGWITFLSKGTFPMFKVTEAIQYRKIGGIVFLKGELSSLTFPKQSKSGECYGLTLPDGYKPTARFSVVTNVEHLSDGRMLFTKMTSDDDGRISLNFIASEAASSAVGGLSARLDVSFLADA